MSTRY